MADKIHSLQKQAHSYCRIKYIYTFVGYLKIIQQEKPASKSVGLTE